MSESVVIGFAAMMQRGREVRAANANKRRQEEWAERLRDLFGHMTRDEVRALWDSFDEDTSFCGEYDCEDVHGYLNLIGDGRYCAV